MKLAKPLTTLAVAALTFIPAGAENPRLSCTTRGMDIDVMFYSPTIVRVVKRPQGTPVPTRSLAVVKSPDNTEVTLSTDSSCKTASSQKLSVTVDTSTGSVNFTTPSGERLLLDYATSFTPENHSGVNYYRIRDAFMLDSDEPIYGIGQVMDGKFNRRHSTHHLQNENMFTYSAYFMSPTKGYALYSDNYSISDFTDNEQLLEFSQLGDASDYYFIYGGTPDGIIADMRDLTGHAPMLPLWAYGFFQSKERYGTQQESLDVLKRFRELRIPIDCMIQDWRYWPQYNGTDSLWNNQSFDPERFPDPKAWADEIHHNNAKLLIVTWPGVGAHTDQYKELDRNGHLLGFLTFPHGSGARPYDVYSPEARDIFWKHLDKGVFSKIGNDGWWLDSTEPDHIERKESDYDVMTAAGPYREMKNAYSMMHNTGIAEHQKAQTRDKRVVILTRSGHIGQQRLGSNTWSGDVESTWDMLEKQIPAALNFTLMGIPNWNSDIGGFWAGRWQEGGGTRNPEYQELYTRWMQFGTFCPMMRSHGTGLPREIWNFGDPGDKWFDAQADMIHLRYRLLPYIYSTSWDVSANDGTFMRPLLMDYLSDKNTLDIGGQYMFGRNLLVSPVTRPGVEKWETYLPAGNDWWDFWDNRRIGGGHTDSRNVPANIVPLYVKAGAIIPFGPDVQYSSQKPWNDIEVRVYPGANGEFTLYEDEFDNYNYENGASSTITFRWNDADRTLTIADRKGSYPGMLKKRKFRVALVGEDCAPGNKPATATKTVSYNGRRTIVKL